MKIILPGELELKLTDSCALTMAISIGFALYTLTYIAIKLPDCKKKVTILPRAQIIKKKSEKKAKNYKRIKKLLLKEHLHCEISHKCAQESILLTQDLLPRNKSWLQVTITT